jgi:uncharacterized iron-regulated protein
LNFPFLNLFSRLIIVGGCFVMSGFGAASADDGPTQCDLQSAQWLDPSSGREITSERLFEGLADKSVVLLGEVHDNRDHHLWQHYMLAALHARNPDMILGLEMLPRRVQPVLDDWSQGKLDEAALLEQSQWTDLWGYDASLYLPLLHFARLHRIPTIALNVDRQLVSKVGAEGWQSLAAEERMGLSDPAPASAQYRLSLAELYAYKLQIYAHGEEDATTEGGAGLDDMDLQEIMQSEAFAHFVDAQLTWDRAMAEAIAAAHRRDPDAQIVGIVGRGHIESGYGIPHQLADLGIEAVEVLLPVDVDTDCDAIPVDLADALFVVEPQALERQPRPTLGVMIESGVNGVRVMEVVAGSVAEQAGMQAGDVIYRAAGFEVLSTGQLIEVIQRQAPGTWLPLQILRAKAEIELLARFPQSFD